MFPMMKAIQAWTKNDRSIDFDGPSVAAKSEDVIALIEKAFQMKECAYVMVSMSSLTAEEIETLSNKGFRCEKRSERSTQIFRAETTTPEPATVEIKEAKEAKEDGGVTPNFMKPLPPRPASQSRPFVAADIRQRTHVVKLLQSVEYRWKLQHDDESDSELRHAAKQFSEMVKAKFEGQSDMDVAAVRSVFERGDAFQISIQPAGENWKQMMQSLDTARFGRMIGIDTQKWVVSVQMVGFF